MKSLIRIFDLITVATFLLSSCAGLQKDKAGPLISEISTSGKVVVISDCLATTVTISAKVTDESEITNVLLWYRVGAERPFASAHMDLQSGFYVATLKGSALQGNEYGGMEFYVTAEDEHGNRSKSSVDKSIQFLPCINN